MFFAADITPTANFQSAGASCTGTLTADITPTADFQSAGASCAYTLADIGSGAATSLLRATGRANIHLGGTTEASPHTSRSGASHV
jgi:hypothetical protein